MLHCSVVLRMFRSTSSGCSTSARFSERFTAHFDEVLSNAAMSVGMPSHQLGRIQRHELDESLVADVAAVDEYLVAYRIGAFQSDDAVGCFEESAGLLFECVRGMVGGDHVHGAVLDRFESWPSDPVRRAVVGSSSRACRIRAAPRRSMPDNAVRFRR